MYDVEWWGSLGIPGYIYTGAVVNNAKDSLEEVLGTILTVHCALLLATKLK